MPVKIDEYFHDFIRNLNVDEYDKCSAAASNFLTDFPDLGDVSDADIYRPYANYFRIFADAYRLWQVSYVYTDIRNQFNLAGYLLERDIRALIEEGRITDESKFLHENLVLAFGNLSRMLCFYTRCENSFVSNDPFSLERFSDSAFQIEKATIITLEAEDIWPGTDDEKETWPILYEIRDWLLDYFKTNKDLHSGLKECAGVYWNIFRRISDELDAERLEVARDSYKSLREGSDELASELNAHIEHISRHRFRLENVEQELEPQGFLRVTCGKLVLALSATCSDEWVRTQIYGLEDIPKLDSSDFAPDRILLDRFEAMLTERFDKKFKRTFTKKFFKDGNHALINFRTLKRHDIFETTFGKYYLQTLAFNLPDIELWTLDDRKFVFDTTINLSTLGVCTVYFELNIDNIEGGLSVEEIRLLQTCICPHAGEVSLDFVEPEGALETEAEPEEEDNEPAQRQIFDWTKLDTELAAFQPLLNRLAVFCNGKIEMLRAVIREIPKDEKASQATLKKLHRLQGLLQLNDYLHYMIDISNAEKMKSLLNVQADPREPNRYFVDSPDFTVAERLAYVSKSLEYLSELEIVPKVSRTRLRRRVNNLSSIFNTYPYLSKIAANYLDTVRDVFEEMDPYREEFQNTESGINRNWQISPDTGWYSYLFATCIDKVGTDLNDALAERVGFDEITDHPDTIGFKIEQREARASFDDWRFMDTKAVSEEQNLAHIRSHQCDAFFGSEYQSFLYFPSDPQFLMDQYEETVRLMMRLSVMLKSYNARTYDLVRQIRNDLADPATSTRHLTTHLKDIQDLRFGAGETISLTANAGISRYKDHGVLMRTIVEKMKLNTVVASINRHLFDLDNLTRNILAAQEAERMAKEAQREKNFNRVGMLLTLFFAAIAIDALVKALSNIRAYRVSDQADKATELLKASNEGIWTVGIWLVVSIGLWVWYNRKK